MGDILTGALSDDRLPVVRPDGTLASVRKANYEKAIAAGYRHQTADEQEKFASQLKFGERPLAAAAAGAGRGLTLGLSDIVLPSTGLVERETLKGLQEENPGASTAGDLAGTAASLLVAPEASGPGLVAKVGRLVEGAPAASRLARLAAKGAAGAVEGSLFGAGNAVSDAALGDQQLNAEKLISHMGLGAVLGGGTGALVGGVGEAARAILPKATTLAGNAQGILDELANDSAVKSTRATQAEIARIGDGNVQEIGDLLRSRGHIGDKLTDFRSPEEILASTTKDREGVGQSLLKQMGVDVPLPHDAGQEEAVAAVRGALDKRYGPAIGKALEDIDTSGQFPGGATPAYSEILKSLDDMSARVASNPAERDFAEPIIKKARGYIEELGQRPVGKDNGFAMLNRVKSTLADDVNYAGQSSARNRIERDVVRTIKEQIDSQIEQHAGAAASKEFIDAKRAYALLSHGLEEGLGRKASTGADAIAEMAKKAGLASPEVRLFERLGQAQQLAERGTRRPGGIAYFGIKDLLTGQLGLGGLSHPLGMVAALGSKFMREHGDALIAKFADRLSSSPALSAAAQSFATKLPQIAPAMGQYGRMLLTKAALSPSSALAAHVLHAQVDPEYVAAARTAGLNPETPDEHQVAVARSTNLAALAASLKQHDEEIDRHVAAVFTGRKASPDSPSVHGYQDFGAKQMRRDSLESHRQMVKEAAELAADPSAIADRVAKNMGRLGNEAPGILGALNDRAFVAAQYLAQAGAAPPKKGPLAPEYHPPQTEIWKYAQKVEAVRDPMSVLRDTASGMLTRDKVDAMKAVHPTLYRDISDRMLSKLAESPEGVPYQSRLMISIFTGMDVDGTMSPRLIAANQQAISTAQGKPSEQQGKAPAGTKELTVGAMAASPSERREIERMSES